VQSLVSRNAGIDVYKAFVNLKIIWSMTASAGIGISILQGAPVAAWLFLFLFFAFACTWIYSRQALAKVSS
jgi:hypothetical protein